MRLEFFISLLSYNIFNENIYLGRQPRCSLCWNDFILGTTLKRIICGHIFHRACITIWHSKVSYYYFLIICIILIYKLINYLKYDIFINHYDRNNNDSNSKWIYIFGFLVEWVGFSLVMKGPSKCYLQSLSETLRLLKMPLFPVIADSESSITSSLCLLSYDHKILWFW